MKLYILMLAASLVCSQSFGADSEKKLLKKARKELSKGNYGKAKEHYLRLLEVSPNNPEYEFEAGLSFYNSAVEVEQSVVYFEDALRHSGRDTIAEVLYYLGRAYQYNEQFSDAIDTYNHFKAFIKRNDKGIPLMRDVSRFIEMCNNGISYVENPKTGITVHNLERHINTQGGEYASVVTKDGNLMLFTGRRTESTGTKFYHDNRFYEDIYVTRYENEEWTFANKFDSSNVYINKNINSKWHDAAIAFNANEDKLYIYRKNHVWVSELVDGKWADPVKMNKNINSKGHEPSVFISKDEATLLVVSTDRDGGRGGRDIWMTTKNSDGEWDPLKNLGSTINTEFDEDAPFLTADGKTLYFSSTGHSTMGGYDVFKSELVDGKWTEPVNLGAPINTPAHDIYYSQDEEGKVAYISSSRVGGYGDMDLYMIMLECQSIPTTEIKGLLLAGDRQFPLGGQIVVKNQDGQEVGRYDVDPETGRYLMILKPEETYDLELTATNPWYVVRPHKETFTLPKQCDPYPLYQEINLSRLMNDTGKIVAQEALFRNAFLTQSIEDTASSHFSMPSFDTELKELPADSLQFNIAGNLKFSDHLKVEDGAKIYLLDEDLKIVRIEETTKSGDFMFRNLNPDEIYTVALDENDLKYLYYGTSPTNQDNGIIVEGHMTRVYRNNIRAEENLDSMDVFLFDGDKKVTNLTLTDSTGHFIIDNDAQDTESIANANNKAPFTYNIDRKEMDFAVQAFIRTIDPENNELNYTEVIDIIPISDTVKPPPLSGDLAEFPNIYFDFDKYFLRDTSKQILDRIYAYMSKNPDTKIKMDGHTDWFGTEEYNIPLSENRATSAQKYLLAKGMSGNRIDMEWFGETMPAVPNEVNGQDSPENRQLNRRVEFVITTKDISYTISM